MAFVFIDCPKCKMTLEVKFGAPQMESGYPQYRCPVSQCSGWVNYVEEKRKKPFWGCGECGSKWFDKANLMKEITAIVKKFLYRAKAYKKSAKEIWVPTDPDTQPDSYEDKVEKEPIDTGDFFERG